MVTEGRMNDVALPISDVTKHMTLVVQLTGVRIFAVRMRLGLLLLHLAARVMGVGIHVESVRDEFERRDRRQEP